MSLPPDGSVTISEITNTNDWKGPHGTVTYYTLRGDSAHQDDIEFDWGKKGDPPQIGETYTLEFTDGKFRPKATLAQDGGSAPQSGEKTSSGVAEGTDTRSAAIQRQHSQEMAIRWASVQFDGGKAMPEGFGLEELRSHIDWFYDDISSSHDAASSLDGQEASANNGSPPSISAAQADEFLTELKRLGIDKGDVVAKLDLLGVSNIQSITEGVSRLPEEKSSDLAAWLVAFEKHELKNDELVEAGIKF